jgi:hypothetical protein
MRLCLEENQVKATKPYLAHLKSTQDLVTPYEAVRAGFVALALERSRRSTPAVEEARTLMAIAKRAANASGLLKIAEIQTALLTAAGVSDKAAGHMTPEDKNEAIRGLLKNYLEPAGAAFAEELTYRFLLVRGDTLGGAMRNLGGVLAQRKLTRTVISTLSLAGLGYEWLHTDTRAWTAGQRDNAGIENHMKALSWAREGGVRTIIYNYKVPLVGTNVDFSVLDCDKEDITEALQTPKRYIVLGELKGGIDPAGADEHWKTAGSALKRISEAFARKHLSPKIAFIGAAIEERMAKEIWQQLETGVLANAANLTNPNQLSSLVQWLCNL